MCKGQCGECSCSLDAKTIRREAYEAAKEIVSGSLELTNEQLAQAEDRIAILESENEMLRIIANGELEEKCLVNANEEE